MRGTNVKGDGHWPAAERNVGGPLMRVLILLWVFSRLQYMVMTKKLNFGFL